MAIAATPSADRVVILPNISWETYRKISVETHLASRVRLTYDRGCLQIMTLSSRHELPNRLLSALVREAAKQLRLELCESGSTTLDREDLERGCEPDTSFYFRNVSAMMAKEIDIRTDPPPDLIIEVDITRHSLNKLPLFAALGISEVWRYDGKRIHFLLLQDGAYLATTQSRWLAPLTADAATQLLDQGLQEPDPGVWSEAIRGWFESAGVV